VRRRDLSSHHVAHRPPLLRLAHEPLVPDRPILLLRFRYEPAHLAGLSHGVRGQERRRFTVPTQFLNLPVFVGLLERAEEDGFQGDGSLERGEDFLVYFGFFLQKFWVGDSDRLEWG
jgi:hypothetical protein